ncbi:hypothetical protein BDV96DRAFT_507240 [Lophiotrema nucula]|uniref:Cytochrome P450 n=1 Tax=Lophiotrema nucula TaxID=690887 RepID=A0A6A5YKD2_9PLEO|nr:hypothetical protein BDV96DRAFT_507240 [Lophiotrema nucula]
MGVSRNLFLGVYASESGIRVLFLPLCYAIFISPFVALVVWKYQLDQTIAEYIPNDYKTADRLPQLFVSLTAVILVTRLVSGKRHGANIKEGGKRRVQLLPYWVPGARHSTNLIFGGDKWLKNARDSSTMSIFGYNLAGAKRNVILSASLLDQVSSKTDSFDETNMTSWVVPHNAFGMPNFAKEQYLKLWPRISGTLDSEVMKGEGLKKVVTKSLSILSDSLPDFITFNSSIVDQMQWERVAGVELSDGTVEVECELFNLVNEFFCNAILPPITGSQLPESYQLLASDLATFNQSFYALALGLPRFFPVPGLPGAKLAKKNLLRTLTNFFNELANPPMKRPVEDDESESGEELDADTPTPLTALHEQFQHYDIPLTARASITLELLHSIISEAVPLAFWILVHLYSTSQLTAGESEDSNRLLTPVEMIREDTKAWAKAIQPPSLHPSFPAPPAISFEPADEVFDRPSFSYLRSTIKEARRLYGASLATVAIKNTIVLDETESMRPGKKLEWELEEGSCIDVGISQTLINTSAANYIASDQFIADRFLHSQSLPPISISWAEPAEELTTALLVAFISGVTQLWDIKAAPKKTIYDHWQEASAAASGEDPTKIQTGREKKVGTWVIPKAVDGAAVKLPSGEVKVRIRRREGLPEPRTRQKG